MLDSECYKKMGSGNRYPTNVESTMNENGSIEENGTASSWEIVGEEVADNQTLTHEAVNEQIKEFIAPLFRLLEELTRLVQDLVTTLHPGHYLTTDPSAVSGAASHQSDTVPAMYLSRKFLFCRFEPIKSTAVDF